jgi:hypothetical protein
MLYKWEKANTHVAGVNGPTITLEISFLPSAINAAVILWKTESTHPFLQICEIIYKKV